MKGNFKTPEKWQAVLEEHFFYLPKEERNKMICGDEFVEVLAKELERLFIDVYNVRVMRILVCEEIIA